MIRYYLDKTGLAKLVANCKERFAAKEHTHNYAGSTDEGGAAASAVKLETSRTIRIEGAIEGSASFDGTEDVTITATGNDLFLSAHPVGSYFFTSSPVDPGELYGGVWESAPSMGPHAWLRKE